jgi:outer membrane biosynthesis protein TonB
LWFFIREDGGVADTRLWRSSGSAEIDQLALELGREIRWQPATCGGQPWAKWYGHPMAMGGAQ